VPIVRHIKNAQTITLSKSRAAMSTLRTNPDKLSCSIQAAQATELSDWADRRINNSIQTAQASCPFGEFQNTVTFP